MLNRVLSRRLGVGEGLGLHTGQTAEGPRHEFVCHLSLWDASSVVSPTYGTFSEKQEQACIVTWFGHACDCTENCLDTMRYSVTFVYVRID